MRISGWLFLAQQTMAALCLLMAVGQCLGASVRVTWRVLGCAAGLGIVVSGAVMSGSAAVRFTAVPVAAVMPLLAYPTLFPAALRALPGITLLGVCLALGWSQVLARLPLPPWLGLIFTCGLLLLLPQLLPQAPTPRHAVLEICIGRKRVRLEALVDTGNLLRDPVTGLPVVVVAPQQLARLIAVPSPDALTPGMRLMPVHTFSGTAMLILIRPDRLTLNGRRISAMVAPAPTQRPRFQALVPGGLVVLKRTGG